MWYKILRQNKSLRSIQDKEGLEGYALIDDNCYEIFINVERLWKQSNGSIDRFAKKFSDVHSHELLHFLIRRSYKNKKKYEYGEECIIWKLLGNHMSKEQRRFYLKS